MVTHCVVHFALNFQTALRRTCLMQWVWGGWGHKVGRMTNKKFCCGNPVLRSRQILFHEYGSFTNLEFHAFSRRFCPQSRHVENNGAMTLSDWLKVHCCYYDVMYTKPLFSKWQTWGPEKTWFSAYILCLWSTCEYWDLENTGLSQEN